jgi:hypothetical protein
MTIPDRDPVPSVMETLFSFPRITLTILAAVAVASVVGFSLFPGLGQVEIGLAILAQLTFALDLKLLFFLMIRGHRKLGFSAVDRDHRRAFLVLFAIGSLLGASPSWEAYKICPHCFSRSQ